MITAYTDGACRGGNPGYTSASFVVYDGDKETFGMGRFLGQERRTNNYAEYKALLYLLSYLQWFRIRGVTIYSDSQLVVNQVNQEWAINKDELSGMALHAYGLLVRGSHHLEHVKGHDGNKGNERADQLANEALDIAGIPLA